MTISKFSSTTVLQAFTEGTGVIAGIILITFDLQLQEYSYQILVLIINKM